MRERPLGVLHLDRTKRRVGIRLKPAVDVELVQLERHGTVENLVRERTGCFVHVDSPHDDKVGRDRNAALRNKERLKLLGCFMLHTLVHNVNGGLEQSFVRNPHQRVRDNLAILDAARLDNAQIFGEVLFDRRKVHLVETEEERNSLFLVKPRLGEKTHKVRDNILRAINARNIPHQPGGVVPIRTHRDALVVSGMIGILCQVAIRRATSPRQLSHDSRLSRPAHTSKQNKRLRPDRCENRL